jgi:hypothetical protein
MPICNAIRTACPHVSQPLADHPERMTDICQGDRYVGTFTAYLPTALTASGLVTGANSCNHMSITEEIGFRRNTPFGRQCGEPPPGRVGLMHLWVLVKGRVSVNRRTGKLRRYLRRRVLATPPYKWRSQQMETFRAAIRTCHTDCQKPAGRSNNPCRIYSSTQY